MRTILRSLFICLLFAAAIATAQENANPFSTFNKAAYARMKGIMLASAEKMPEESYSFNPTDSIRSYGQLVGHLADAQYLFCSIALGEKNPGLKIEQTKTSKADLIAALKEALFSKLVKEGLLPKIVGEFYVEQANKARLPELSQSN